MKELKYTNMLKILKVDKYRIYGWDDTKRAEVALFSLWSLLKRKILEIGQRVQSKNYQK